MIEVDFDAISSKFITSLGTGGQRDYSISLIDSLKTDEIVTDIEITSSNDDALTITNSVIGLNDKSVNFRVTVTAGTTAKLVVIYVAFEGNSGSGDTYHCNQPIFTTLPI